MGRRSILLLEANLVHARAFIRVARSRGFGVVHVTNEDAAWNRLRATHYCAWVLGDAAPKDASPIAEGANPLALVERYECPHESGVQHLRPPTAVWLQRPYAASEAATEWEVAVFGKGESLGVMSWVEAAVQKWQKEQAEALQRRMRERNARKEARLGQIGSGP